MMQPYMVLCEHRRSTSAGDELESTDMSYDTHG